MKVQVLKDIIATPAHYDIPASVYTASVYTWEEGRQRRVVQGYKLTARIEGYGWKTINVPKEYYDGYVADDSIIEIKEEANVSNLPMVKADCAVLPVSPQEQINQASDMARLLKEVVSKAGLARKLGGRKEHLEYEAWATIARWFHCTPSTEWTKPIKDGEKIIGWEARVNILDESGRVIGSSEGMCMSDEANWRGKPSYALRSMAQTRTAGKALRSLFAHIAVLAGYSPTPADEMDGVEVREEAPKPQTPDDAATDKQKKMLFAKANEKFGSREKALEFIKHQQDDAPYWTKKAISELLDDFDAQADIFLKTPKAA